MLNYFADGVRSDIDKGMLYKPEVFGNENAHLFEGSDIPKVIRS